MKKLFLILLIVNYSLPIVKTQWVQQTVPVSKPITGIKFIDVNTGWACTENSGTPNRAYILFTSNGGINWIIQDSVNNATYGAISVINGNTVYCGGYDFSSNSANLRKTTNGGINWLLIPTPTNMAIGDMQFLNVDSGWTTVGNVGADVRTTTNGGLNWIVRTSGIAAQTQRIFFLNYNTGFCGAQFRIYKTTDAGLNWFLNSVFSDPPRSIYFINENTGWVGTVDAIHYTSNGGTNWGNTTFPPLFGNITDIQFLTFNRGYGGNRSTRILITTNGGTTWGYQIDNSASYRISFVDTNNGWSGDNGISRTTNGGGQITYVGIITINVNIPKTYELFQNYPNPFNSQTNIKFSLTKRSFVQFKIYDVTGKEKTMWQSDKELDAGTHELQFDANDLASGIYFYNIIVSDEKGNTRFKETKKMILVK